MTATEALDRVNETHGLALSFEGRCPGGEVGAHYAGSADGQRFVFKWSDDADDLDYFSAVSTRVARLRALGYPAPRYLPPLAVEGGVVLLQEAVAGRWRDDVDDDLVATARRLNDLQSGQGEDRDGWTSYISMTLTEGADGYCLHEPLRAHSAETRSLVEWVERVGASLGSLPSRDLVHIDFRLDDSPPPRRASPRPQRRSTAHQPRRIAATNGRRVARAGATRRLVSEAASTVIILLPRTGTASPTVTTGHPHATARR